MVMFTKIKTSLANWLVGGQLVELEEKLKAVDKRLSNEMIARKNETNRIMKEINKDWVGEELDKADIKNLEEAVSRPIFPES